MSRIRIIAFGVVCLFLLLVLRILNLQVLCGRHFKELSDKNCIRLLPQPGARGRILDSRGCVIVDNRISYDVMIWPQGAQDMERLFSKVSAIIGVSSADLKKQFKNNCVSSSVPVVIAKNIDKKKAMILEELKLEMPQVVMQAAPVRNYPYAKLGSHVIGYVSQIDRWRLTKLEDYGYKTKDIVGFGGVEEKFDYYLRQEEGGLSIQVDHRGRFMRVLGFRSSARGADLQLTLDLKMQKIVQENLEGKTGCVIIMEPYSGEIVAMASFPDFDPSLFVNGSVQEISTLFNDPDSPFINRAISGQYPAGSIFKVIVAAAALETKKIGLSTSFLCTGHTMIGKQKFACWDTHGRQDLLGAIAHSCNIFFYRTGLLLGAQTIYDYAVKFGLSKPTGFELPYESSGFVPSPLWRRINKFRSWFDGDTANLSIGQGDVLVTPLQMARMMAVFANRGYLVTPYIIRAVGDRDISFHQRKIEKIPLKETTINSIRQGLREVVSEPGGTANVLSALTVSVAGKTGTAQAPPGQPHGWFVGFFPFKNPKYVICVFLERGQAGYYSATLAKKIISAMISEGMI